MSAPAMSDDERLARQLQEAEIGQAGLAASGLPPVVPATVVGAAYPSPAQAAPVAIGVPVRPIGWRCPPYSVEVGTVGSEEELIVLSYRRALICFAAIDTICTLLNAISAIEDATRFHNRSAWQIPLIGLVFLLGPLCGILGAKGLKRGLVTVYLIFSIMKMLWELFLVLVTPYLWFLIIFLIQMWITKMVFTFWRALGRIPKEQLPRLLEQKDMAHMVYW
mmetsp:Transcript_88405/g.189841  ORF Transcript_88405/g.189841 Transcript_88405/m.189841 type:complete len:221 (+) Transcript_88405:100-762(+)